jgi:predicted enzyme related to lactoylglutathione lyase
MIEKVAYAAVFVKDQDEALAFYTDALDFQKRADNPTPWGRFIGIGLEYPWGWVAVFQDPDGNRLQLRQGR